MTLRETFAELDQCLWPPTVEILNNPVGSRLRGAEGERYRFMLSRPAQACYGLHDRFSIPAPILRPGALRQ